MGHCMIGYTDYCSSTYYHRHITRYMLHWCTDIPTHGLPHVLLVLHRYMDSQHITVTHACRCLYSCHMDPRSCYMYYCSMLLYSCYMIDSRYRYCWIPVHATCITVPCYCIHVICLYPVTDMDFPILDMRTVDMRYVDFHIYCSCYIVLVILFPFLVILVYAIDRTLVQLSCYPYHVQ